MTIDTDTDDIQQGSDRIYCEGSKMRQGRTDFVLDRQALRDIEMTCDP